MCTAFHFVAEDHYFCRNLDLDYHYDENIIITPRGYRYPFRHISQPNIHYAMIGIATKIDDVPLYYDAVNEKGLCMAGLNFPGHAVYRSPSFTKVNIASFELIPWILNQCASVDEAENLIKKINICDISFSKELAPTPLHWIIADRHRAIVVEPMKDCIHITPNPIGVITNNPPLPYHIQNLSNYINLTPEQPSNRFSKKLELNAYSLGMGALGLPGDFSSSSRFVRCAFLKENSIWGNTEEHRIHQAFHILDNVAQLDGCVKTALGFEKTIYSICCNASKGIFYYTTYNNRQITGIHMDNCDLEGKNLITLPMIVDSGINYQS